MAVEPEASFACGVWCPWTQSEGGGWCCPVHAESHVCCDGAHTARGCSCGGSRCPVSGRKPPCTTRPAVRWKAADRRQTLVGAVQKHVAALTLGEATAATLLQRATFLAGGLDLARVRGRTAKTVAGHLVTWASVPALVRAFGGRSELRSWPEHESPRPPISIWRDADLPLLAYMSEGFAHNIEGDRDGLLHSA
jgi:hypothetical protein